MTVCQSSDVQTRRALTDALCSLVPLTQPLADFNEHVNLLLAMMRDGDIGVRLALARGVVLFFDMFDDQRAVMTSLRAQLHALDESANTPLVAIVVGVVDDDVCRIMIHNFFSFVLGRACHFVVDIG